MREDDAVTLTLIIERLYFTRCTASVTSVARGRGGGGGNNGFSEFCRYIWKFVATCKPTSMSFVPTKYLKYQQKIERNSSFRLWKREKKLLIIFNQC